MFPKMIATLFSLALISIPASAALISIEKVDTQISTANALLAEYWSNFPENLKTTDDIEIATLLYNGSVFNNTLFKMTINLDHNQDFVFDLYAGLDAGRGAEVFQNEQKIFDANYNIWWQRNWQHSHVISLEDLFFSAGKNQLVLYWAENFNSGGNSFEFAFNDGNRMVLSQDNLEQYITQVTEPNSLLILAISLLLLCSRQRLFVSVLSNNKRRKTAKSGYLSLIYGKVLVLLLFFACVFQRRR
jgi:hypothetical protein